MHAYINKHYNDYIAPEQYKLTQTYTSRTSYLLEHAYNDMYNNVHNTNTCTRRSSIVGHKTHDRTSNLIQHAGRIARAHKRTNSYFVVRMLAFDEFAPIIHRRSTTEPVCIKSKTHPPSTFAQRRQPSRVHLVHSSGARATPPCN